MWNLDLNKSVIVKISIKNLGSLTGLSAISHQKAKELVRSPAKEAYKSFKLKSDLAPGIMQEVHGQQNQRSTEDQNDVP